MSDFSPEQHPDCTDPIQLKYRVKIIFYVKACLIFLTYYHVNVTHESVSVISELWQILFGLNVKL